jgi:hypothetical protein
VNLFEIQELPHGNVMVVLKGYGRITSLTDEEGRQLAWDLTQYYEKKDRDSWSDRLTRRVESNRIK